MIRKYLT